MDVIPLKRLHSLQTHVDGTVRPLAPGHETDDLRGRSHGSCAAGDGTEDNAAGANLCAVAHSDIPEDLGACPDQNMLPNLWITVAALLAGLFLLGKRW